MYSVLKYINEHIGEALTAANLAEHFGYSPWYFSDLFHRFTGTVFCEYIRHQRMQLAAMEVLDGVKEREKSLSLISLFSFLPVQHYDHFQIIP